MNTLNKVIFIGFISTQPLDISDKKQTAIAEFKIMTQHTFTRKGAQITQTDEHNIVAVEPLASKILATCKKGFHVRVEGRLKYQKYKMPKSLVERIKSYVLIDFLIKFSEAESTNLF